MEYVQYIVVRKDLVDIMGVGKVSAQVAHASLGVVLDGKKLLEHPNIYGWLEGPFVKLVCYVKTKQKLLNLSEKLDSENIRHKLIYDACRTMLEPEEPNGTTLTCFGVIPLARNDVPKCLQKLQLL
jgi:peptidyl-tRNA hydrolase